MRIFENTLISKRIRLLTLAVIASFVATASVLIANEVAHGLISKAKTQSTNLTVETANLNHLAFEAQNTASSFLATQNPEFERVFRTLIEDLKENILLFQKHDLVEGYPPLTKSTENVLVKIETYSSHMKSIFTKWNLIGINEKTGLHGEIRDEAHSIEAILRTMEDNTEADLKSQLLLLAIRRSEKDYMQRLDNKYTSLLWQSIEALKQLSQSSFSASTNQAIQAHLSTYKKVFEKFVIVRTDIIADEKIMRDEVSEIVESIEELRQATINHIAEHDEKVNDLREIYSYVAFGAVFVTGVIVIGIAQQVSKSITQPLNAITSVMQSFLRNDYSVSVAKFSENTEFGDMSALLIKMKEQDEARVKSEKNLQQAYDSLDERVKERTVELENANEELSQFAYVISHDIKAPLRAIHNYSDFLVEDLSGKLGEEQQGYLVSMAKAVTEGEQMIEDVLALSRIGRADTEIQVVDIKEIISSVKNLLGLHADCKFVCSGIWPPVPTNAILLKQVLSNLIGNGFKFNKSKFKKVEVSGGEKQSDGENVGKYIEIRVQDNGIGIDQKYRENIFKIFHRLHTKKEYDGTGVGLAIVKKAMTELRGTIVIEDAENGGTCFVLSLPLELDMKGETNA
ncbi:MAG: ATP-binding protein [Halopseudomonas aestusnigri]